jgi:hypothetical protein
MLHALRQLTSRVGFGITSQVAHETRRLRQLKQQKCSSQIVARGSRLVPATSCESSKPVGLLPESKLCRSRDGGPLVVERGAPPAAAASSGWCCSSGAARAPRCASATVRIRIARSSANLARGGLAVAAGRRTRRGPALQPAWVCRHYCTVIATHRSKFSVVTQMHLVHLVHSMC